MDINSNKINQIRHSLNVQQSLFILLIHSFYNIQYMLTMPNQNHRQKENSPNERNIIYHSFNSPVKIGSVLLNHQTAANKHFFKRLQALKGSQQPPPEKCYSNIYHKIKLYQINLTKKNKTYHEL